MAIVWHCIRNTLTPVMISLLHIWTNFGFCILKWWIYFIRTLWQNAQVIGICTYTMYQDSCYRILLGLATIIIQDPFNGSYKKCPHWIQQFMKNSKKDSLLFAKQVHFGQECLQTSALSKLLWSALKVPQVWQKVKFIRYQPSCLDFVTARCPNHRHENEGNVQRKL